MVRRHRQGFLDFRRDRNGGKRGGAREGAGRKPNGLTAGVSHRTRPVLAARYPVHVTMRVGKDVPNLRASARYAALREAFRRGCLKDAFRLVHYAVMGNHLHLVCEAEDARALARGMQGLATRLARRFNRACGRSGRVFADRYHARALRTPREVRNCLVYVLQNARKHARERGRSLSPGWFDPCSSAAWFEGWVRPLRFEEPWMKELRRAPPPVAEPTCWLLSTGWKQCGPVRLDELPAS